MVANGYPGDYDKGQAITGLNKIASGVVFHAGTKASGDNIVTNGGRVLAVTGKGNTLDEATKEVYKAVSSIHWDGVYFRKDIGEDLKKWAKTL
jgi:phosphoribosylamine--glycine ligase